MVLEGVKGKYDTCTEGKGWKDEFNKWYGVETGKVKYIDVVRENYAYMCVKKGERGCKGVEGDELEGDGVGPMI